MSTPQSVTVPQSAHRRIPLWLKLVYTAFVLVMVPHYWKSYGPTNFLYFCDMAVFFTLGAMWLEWPVLASMPAVGILLPQALWMVDFLGELAGFKMSGMTGYMFDQSIPQFTRGISLFHFWLPILLVWLVWRLGYDRRALAAWTLVAWALVLVSYFWLPAPPAPTDNPNRVVNVNYVYGFSATGPQQWMPQPLYVLTEMAVLAIAIFVPTHLILAWLFPRRELKS